MNEFLTLYLGFARKDASSFQRGVTYAQAVNLHIHKQLEAWELAYITNVIMAREFRGISA